MKLKRGQGPERVLRAMAFPVYLILVVDTRHNLPVPMVSQRDGRWGCHVECTEAEAERCIRTLGAYRAKHREHYPTIVGSVMLTVKTPEELRAMAEAMIPKPEGFFYESSINWKANEWVSTFVPWDKMHGPFRPGLG
jgi:hypothetical protein